MGGSGRGWFAGRASGLRAIDDDPELVVVDSNQHDRAVLTGGRGRPQPQEFVEEDHGHEAAAHADDVGSGEALDPRATIGPQ